jgi:hypothetical protein
MTYMNSASKLNTFMSAKKEEKEIKKAKKIIA